MSNTVTFTKKSLGEIRDLLDDMRGLASFLQRVLWSMQDADYPLNAEERDGCSQCLEIIKEKAKQVDRALQAGGGRHE